MKSYKINMHEVPTVDGLRPDEGWINMQVQFLVDAASAGSRLIVFGRTVFPPGARHEWHRHHNAEEVQLLLSGEGVVLNGDEEIPVVPGDVVFTPLNEWHGFRNLSDTTEAVVLWAWAGAGSRNAAGYEAR